jgi:hypothetical protein
MSTVKISELALINQLNANTSNTLFVAVDVPTGITGKFTGHTLAQGLYSNEILNVGLNQSFLPNTIAQYSLAGASYIQTNLVNLDDGGTADIVVTANAKSGGTDSAYFIDMGFANANVTPGLEFNNLGTSINPLDGYIYTQGNGVGNAPASGGNLIIGATSTNTEIKFIAGGYNSQNIVAKFTGDGLKMVNGHPIFFADGSSQNTASNPAAYSQASFDKANSAITLGQSAYGQANTATTIGQAAYVQANNALANTTGTFAGNLTLTGSVNSQKGFIYTPTQYPGAQTAITIDFANNSVIRANTSTGCTVSFVNYTSGKEVMLWLTNTTGTNQTFTHGIGALNSTVNATTYNIPGTSTIMARYFSFGGDLANTFVAVVHA